MNILVTGGTGFIGRRLVERLMDEAQTASYEIIVLSRHIPPGCDVRVRYVRGDLANLETLKAACKDALAVYHLAAKTGQPTSRKEIAEMRATNIEGTANLLRACIGGCVERFVYLGSTAVYGNHRSAVLNETDQAQPSTLYAETQLQAELLIREFCTKNSIPYVVLRASSVFGEDHPRRHLLGLARAIKKGSFALIGEQRFYVNYVYIGDVVDALLGVPAGSPNQDNFYNVNTPIDLENFISIISGVMGAQRRLPRIPVALGYALALAGTAWYRLTGRQLPIDLDKFHELTNTTTYSNARLASVLPQYPQCGIEKGLFNTINQYMVNGWLA